MRCAVHVKHNAGGTSLEVQWLRLGAFTAVGPGSSSGRGTKTPQVLRHGQKKKKNFVVCRRSMKYGI